MPINKPMPIFQGPTQPGARRALRVLFAGHFEKGEYSRLVIPCVGGFGTAEIAVAAGVKPESLSTSDVNLYTSALGHVFDPKLQVSDLGFEALDPELKGLLASLPGETQFEQAAQILYAIQATQLHTPKEWNKWQRRAYMDERDRIHAQLTAGLEKLHTKLGGLSYQIRDIHDHLTAVWDDPSTWAFYHPPCYSRGYTEMFDPKEQYRWAAELEGLEKLTIEAIAPYTDALLTKPCTGTILYEDFYPAETIREKRWTVFYSEVFKNYQTIRNVRLAVNRTEFVEKALTQRPKVVPVPEDVPAVYDGHEITSESQIGVAVAKKEMALYFYDLFACGLGMSSAETYFLFLIDGQVAGAIGMYMQNYRATRGEIAYMTFGLSMPVGHINRLLLLYVTSRHFIDQVVGDLTPALFLPPPMQLQTTCLAKHATLSINRGILKRIRKEVDKVTGQWKLTYQTAIREESAHAVLITWLGWTYRKEHPDEFEDGSNKPLTDAAKTAVGWPCE